MFLKVLAAILVLFLGYIIFARALPMMEFKKYYSKQGLTFSPGWSFFTDLGAFTKEVMANPNGFPFYNACHRTYGKTLPAVFGVFCGPFHTVILNAPEYLEDVYVKLNSMHTKHEFERRVFNLLIPTSIVFLESEHKDYPERRKILAAAFYKNNVARMIELIKRVTIEIVRDLQQGNVQEVDIIELTSTLQQRIIINVSVGPDFGDRIIDFELEDGKVVKRPIHKVIYDVVSSTCCRADQLLFLIFPFLTRFAISARDRRDQRNIRTLRGELRQIIKEKKASGIQDDTLLSHMLKEDLVKDDFQVMEDDIITFFFAGAFTIQASTSNLIMYSINLPEVKQKILTEVDKLMNFVKDDVREKLTVDVAEEHLVYTRWAYMESLRIEPPASMTTIATFTHDVTFESGVKSKLPRFTLRKGDAFNIAIEEIQKDPRHWHDPESFIPERFDEKSHYYLRPNGEMRHPLAFTPFMGGKRICLGKTFAEITTRLTVPILMHSFNFEYADQAHLKCKPKYTIGMMGPTKVMLKISKRNEVPEY